MELEIKNGKFWILENKSDENNVDRYSYDDERSAMGRIKQLLKSVDAQKLFLSAVDITGKDWQIAGVPWSLIAMGIVREECAEQKSEESKEL